MELTQSIQIKQPCPVPLSKLKASGNNFYCKGCAKSVIDFRGKTMSEIQSRCAAGNVCGVFNQDQLTNHIGYKGLNLVLFKTLTILALLGFNVSPLKAQLDNFKADNIKKLAKEITKKMEKTKEEPVQKTQTTSESKPKHVPRKKKKNFTITGCPSF